MPLPSIPCVEDPRPILPGEAGWPSSLNELATPPTQVHLRGCIPPGPRVAIVGTRRADPEALEHAYRLAADVAQLGCVVVSGGARGIDAAAHRGALSVEGSTVAVLATGVERAYPREHAQLFAAVALSGALISESRDARPDRWRFLRRNRLIAALAEVVVVVQAPMRSGALSTAALARSLGRPILATPAAPWDPRGTGCLQLLRSGAPIADIETIARHFGLRQAPPNALASAPIAKSLDGETRRVLELLGPIPRHVDEIAASTGFEIAAIQRSLTFLRLSNLIEDRGPGTVALRLVRTKRK